MHDAFGDLIVKTPIKVLFQDYTTIHKRVYVLYTCINGVIFASSLIEMFKRTIKDKYIEMHLFYTVSEYVLNYCMVFRYYS